MTEKQVTVEEARELGLELLRELSPHVGDAAAINATLAGWMDVLGFPTFPYACMAALHQAFLNCMTVVPATQPQAGDVTYTEPEAAA